MANTRRVYRVGEKLREAIARRLLQVSDPRFYLVSVTSAIISPDLREAKIYWSVSGGPERVAQVKDAFQAAAGYFQANVAKELGLQFAPRLRFYYDNTLDVFEHVNKLLASVKQPEPEESEYQDEDSDPVTED
jgi:ribosome-binding factor A